MAKMKSHLFSVIRGSVGGITYAANQYQQIVARVRTSPINPGTVPQSIIRLAMGGANEAWDLLTDGERDQWSAYAQGVVYNGPLGPYTVSGRNIALGQYNLASYLLEMGVTSIVAPNMAPPVAAGWLGLGPIILTALGTAGTGFTFGITNPNTEDIVVACQISLMQAPSRMRYKGPWNASYFHFLECPLSSAANLVVDDLPADGIYFCRLKALSNDAPRRMSTSQIYRRIATTFP
jgi:hypothetical protein